MSAIGSVFLGDVQRQRVISTSTPPSSPPPHLNAAPVHSFSDVDIDERAEAPGAAAHPAPPAISPALALELRLRWLETLLFGAKHDIGDQAARGGARPEKLKDGETLSRRAEDLQRRLDSVAQSNDSLKRFMDRCECLFVRTLSTPRSREASLLRRAQIQVPPLCSNCYCNDALWLPSYEFSRWKWKSTSRGMRPFPIAKQG